MKNPNSKAILIIGIMILATKAVALTNNHENAKFRVPAICEHLEELPICKKREPIICEPCRFQMSSQREICLPEFDLNSDLKCPIYLSNEINTFSQNQPAN